VRAENDLQTSLFQRLIEEYPDASVMLDRQYRMSQRIQAFASAEFYDGALRPAPEVAGQTLRDLGVDPADLPDGLAGGVDFDDPDGTRDGNRNVREAERVAEIVDPTSPPASIRTTSASSPRSERRSPRSVGGPRSPSIPSIASRAPRRR